MKVLLYFLKHLTILLDTRKLQKEFKARKWKLYLLRGGDRVEGFGERFFGLALTF